MEGRLCPLSPLKEKRFHAWGGARPVCICVYVYVCAWGGGAGDRSVSLAWTTKNLRDGGQDTTLSEARALSRRRQP